jgi:small-conductance mechanosensitive channel
MNITDNISSTINYLSDKFPDAIWTLIVAVLFFWLGSKVVRWITMRVLRTAYHRTLHKKDLEKRQATLVGLFVAVWRILVIGLAAIAIMRLFFRDVDLAPLFASAGIIGIALGIGSQSLIKDFLSGVFIITENQYRVGDIVDLEGAAGTVERIGLRSTVLRDENGNVHFVPNGFVQHVINKTMGYSMARFTLAVTPAANVDTVVELIDDIGKKLSKEEAWKHKIIEAPQFLMVGDITSTAVNLIVAGKTQPSDQWSVTAEMRRRILEAFESRGIELGMSQAVATQGKPRKK